MRFAVLISVVALCGVVAFAMPASLGAAGSIPTVTGPVAATGIPGNPMHDYPFFATNHELATRGYVEEEFFIQGTANLLDADIQAALKIDKEFLAPNLVLDFLPRNRFTGPDCQNCQHLERLRLQF